jgi:hypothetical protein
MVRSVNVVSLECNFDALLHFTIWPIRLIPSLQHLVVETAFAFVFADFKPALFGLRDNFHPGFKPALILVRVRVGHRQQKHLTGTENTFVEGGFLNAGDVGTGGNLGMNQMPLPVSVQQVNMSGGVGFASSTGRARWVSADWRLRRKSTTETSRKSPKRTAHTPPRSAPGNSHTHARIPPSICVGRALACRHAADHSREYLRWLA